MVTRTLNTHPDILWLSAIFTEKGWPNWTAAAKRKRGDSVAARMASLPAKWSDADQRVADIPELAETLLTLFREKNVIGFKQHLGPIGRLITTRVIALNWPTIILTRSNILASYSSGKIVKVTGQGGLAAGQKPIRAKVEFDPVEFDNFKRWREGLYAHWSEEVKKSGVRLMRIDYTEARTLQGMERMVAFLNQRPGMLGEPPTAKRNSDSILSRFVNPEDVEYYLRSKDLTDWAHEPIGTA